MNHIQDLDTQDEAASLPREVRRDVLLMRSSKNVDKRDEWVWWWRIDRFETRLIRHSEADTAMLIDPYNPYRFETPITGGCRYSHRYHDVLPQILRPLELLEEFSALCIRTGNQLPAELTWWIGKRTISNGRTKKREVPKDDQTQDCLPSHEAALHDALTRRVRSGYGSQDLGSEEPHLCSMPCLSEV
jgi:hypothetical protein